MRKSRKIMAAAAVLALTACTKYDVSSNIAEALYGPPPDEEQDQGIPIEGEDNEKENTEEGTQEIQEEEK